MSAFGVGSTGSRSRTLVSPSGGGSLHLWSCSSPRPLGDRLGSECFRVLGVWCGRRAATVLERGEPARVIDVERTLFEQDLPHPRRRDLVPL